MPHQRRLPSARSGAVLRQHAGGEQAEEADMHGAQNLARHPARRNRASMTNSTSIGRKATSAVQRRLAADARPSRLLPPRAEAAPPRCEIRVSAEAEVAVDRDAEGGDDLKRREGNADPEQQPPGDAPARNPPAGASPDFGRRRRPAQSGAARCRPPPRRRRLALSPLSGDGVVCTVLKTPVRKTPALPPPQAGGDWSPLRAGPTSPDGISFRYSAPCFLEIALRARMQRRRRVLRRRSRA